MSKSQSKSITHIPISNRSGQFVKVYTEDYERLMSEGISSSWFLNSNGAGREYVRVEHNGNLSMVARLILGDPSRQMVNYLDGDRTNLCRSNLRLGKSGRKYGRTFAPSK